VEPLFPTEPPALGRLAQFQSPSRAQHPTQVQNRLAQRATQAP
jgi:hypothetical protein